VTREEMLSDAINYAADLETDLGTLNLRRTNEMDAKITLDFWKAIAEQQAIDAGLVTGKTVDDRNRQLITIIEDNDQYKSSRQAWIDAALNRHHLDANVETKRHIVELYKAYLGGKDD
jgi:hypothetical protein